MVETKNQFSLRKLLDSKKATFVISLIAAIIFWMVITAMESPDSKKTVTGIPVSINMEGSYVEKLGLELISDPDSYTTSVTVQGPAYVVSKLGIEDFSAVASLSDTVNGQTINKEGSYEIIVTVSRQGSKVKDNFEILSYSPQTIKIEVDFIRRKTFAVELDIDYAGKIATNFEAGEPYISDAMYENLKVEAPLTDLNKVAAVRAVVDDSESNTISETKNFTGKIKLYDSSNRELPLGDYTVTTERGVPVTTVQVTLPINQIKTVPVKAQFKNVPDGYKTTQLNHTINYKNIYIAGPPSIIGSITEIQLEPIDFDSLVIKNNKIQAVSANLILPDGVTAKSSKDAEENIASATVTFSNSVKYSKRDFTVNQIETKASGNYATLAKKITVTICGPDTILDDLKAKDFYAQIDITSVTAGRHELAARIVCKKTSLVWQSGTYKATVDVK